jgi:hypothetical protein
MHLIYFIERAAGDDKWYHRQDTTSEGMTPGLWLAETINKRGVLSDIILVSATPITELEGGYIRDSVAAAMTKRRTAIRTGTAPDEKP